MMPNHVGEPLRSILGPMGSHWAKKWVKTVKNCHAPKFEFLTTPGSSIWAKNRIYGYDAKSRWGPPRSILEPMGSHWGQKMGQNRKKLPCPKIRNLTTPRSSIWAKNRIYGYDAKSRWGPLGPSWDQWGPIGVKKWVKTVKNYHAPKFVFWLLRGHRFGQKIEFTVMAPNHSRKPLGSLLGPMGSHWVQKMGQNRKKLPCPKIRIFYYSAVIDLGKKSNLRLWRQIAVGTP